ncbi:MAG: MlaA family lipoprotein [bacterium]
MKTKISNPKNLSIFLLFSFFLFLTIILPAGAQDPDTPRQTSFEDPFEKEQTEESPQTSLADPLEGWNRIVFTFNDFFYLKILDPVSRGYQTVTPRPLQTGISNFFSNLKEPIYFFNSLLQVQGGDAHTAFARFTVNSTFGLGGLFDVVGDNPEQVPRSFDQTLARWGAGKGFYIIWPVRGPATLRSSIGWAGDTVMDPTWHIDTKKGVESSALYFLNEAPGLLKQYKRMKQYMLDPYSSVKNAYSKQLNYQFKK